VPTIKKILGVMEDVVEIDEEVEERRRMERARVLLKTPWKPSIQHTFSVHIGTEVYEVQIVEERAPYVDSWQGARRSGMLSLDDIDSDRSLMESPASVRSQGRTFKITTADNEERPNTTAPYQTGSRSHDDDDVGHASPLPNGRWNFKDPAGKGNVPLSHGKSQKEGAVEAMGGNAVERERGISRGSELSLPY